MLLVPGRRNEREKGSIGFTYFFIQSVAVNVLFCVPIWVQFTLNKKRTCTEAYKRKGRKWKSIKTNLITMKWVPCYISRRAKKKKTLRPSIVASELLIGNV
jgi:hypothetical protein